MNSSNQITGVKKVAKLLACVAFTLFISLSVYAQNSSDLNGGTDPDARIPFDGGLIYALLSGAGIGALTIVKTKTQYYEYNLIKFCIF